MQQRTDVPIQSKPFRTKRGERRRLDENDPLFSPLKYAIPHAHLQSARLVEAIVKYLLWNMGKKETTNVFASKGGLVKRVVNLGGVIRPPPRSSPSLPSRARNEPAVPLRSAIRRLVKVLLAGYQDSQCIGEHAVTASSNLLKMADILEANGASVLTDKLTANAIVEGEEEESQPSDSSKRLRASPFWDSGRRVTVWKGSHFTWNWQNPFLRHELLRAEKSKD
ncbi:hypothetical protein Trydic_g17150 [Trypoxylus dichotomus]